MKIDEHVQYRPEIDGLRAIAVVIVILFHGGLGFSGGYVGVDVFFVISGFLITSLIWRDLESGHFSFGGFLERRLRRIVPALAVMTVGVLLAGCILMLPIDLISLGKAVSFQSVLSGNIYYWLDSGYFSDNSSMKPLLHTWSIAVEEQFYLVGPFLLLCIFRLPGLRQRKIGLRVLIGLCLCSMLLSVYGIERHPRASFYLLPTRAWELLIGSIVALFPDRKPEFLSWGVIEFCGFLSISLIILPAIFYTPATPFPGLAALPPCFGSALFIWANNREKGNAPSIVGRVLSLKPFVLIGLISYSLYLWHWPVLAFDSYLALTDHGATWRLFMLLIGFILAFLSWKYVETPFRNRQVFSTRRSMLAFAGSRRNIYILPWRYNYRNPRNAWEVD